jgi:hypothetical protein
MDDNEKIEKTEVVGFYGPTFKCDVCGNTHDVITLSAPESRRSFQICFDCFKAGVTYITE